MSRALPRDIRMLRRASEDEVFEQVFAWQYCYEGAPWLLIGVDY